MPARLGLTVVYGLLVLEGVSSAFWIARLLPSLSVRGRTVMALVALRAVASSLQIVGATTLRTGRASGRVLARTALLAAAMLTPFEIGWRLVPTNLDPTYRWWMVVGYWIYAATALRVLRQ